MNCQKCKLPKYTFGLTCTTTNILMYVDWQVALNKEYKKDNRYIKIVIPLERCMANYLCWVLDKKLKKYELTEYRYKSILSTRKLINSIEVL